MKCLRLSTTENKIEINRRGLLYRKLAFSVLIVPLCGCSSTPPPTPSAGAVASATIENSPQASLSEKPEDAAQPSSNSSTHESTPKNSNNLSHASVVAVRPPTKSSSQVTVVEAPRSELALLKIEIMSLKEKMATLQRKLEVILKGQRSGLYEEVAHVSTGGSAGETDKKVDLTERNSKYTVPPLPREGSLDRFETSMNTDDREQALTPEKPQKMVERALMLLEQREFGRVAQLLENFQQRFPNHELSATVELTLAEAYVELKTPQQSLRHVRTFYLQHPNDAQLIRAKWLEARTQILLEAPQKAAQLLREVIAMEPQSSLAQRARAELETLNGGSKR